MASGRSDPTGPPRARFTPQAVHRTLRQLEARAAKASDETLTSAVITGRKALTEWQDLAGRLRQLEGEHERLALSESRALARLQDVLDLLDKFAEPSRLASPRNRSGQPAPGGLIPSPRPSPDRDAPGVLAVRMLGAFELAIDGRRITDWRGQRTQSLMQFLTAHRHRSVSRDELIAAVWPDADEDGGRHRVHQAVYELHGRTQPAPGPLRAAQHPPRRTSRQARRPRGGSSGSTRLPQQSFEPRVMQRWYSRPHSPGLNVPAGTSIRPRTRGIRTGSCYTGSSGPCRSGSR